MSKARGLGTLFAALCVAVAAMDCASAQDESATPGWLLRGRGQNVNPFRATPAPGAGRTLERTQVPPNATANAIGPGWTCNTGFRQQGSTCVPVQVPANASLDFPGHGWMCNQGFIRQGQRCLSLPENASLNALGTAWACNYGFRRQGATCIAVVMPENASLDKAGHNWVCNSGYQRRDQGCIDEATARLQQQADKAVNTQAATGKAAPRPSISVNSDENRLGRTNKATVVIGRF